MLAIWKWGEQDLFHGIFKFRPIHRIALDWVADLGFDILCFVFTNCFTVAQLPL